MILLEVECEAGNWERAGDLDALSEAAAGAVLAAIDDPGGDCAATLLFTDDAQVRDLNRQWRGQDKATNVLSFPSPPMPGSPRHLGDIALAYGTVAREAEEEGKSLSDHTSHLVVHGLLHLLGHDHEAEEEAEAMEATETRILARLGIADPYRHPA